MLPNSFNAIYIGLAQICASLTLTFIMQFLSKKKYFEKFDGKSIFYACRQNGSQTRKNFGYSKVTVVVSISHFRGILIVIFNRINYKEE